MFKFSEEDYNNVFESVNEGYGRLIPEALYSVRQIRNMDAFFPEYPVTTKEAALLLLEDACLIRRELLQYFRHGSPIFNYDEQNYYTSIPYAATMALYTMYRANEDIVTDEGYSVISDFEEYNGFITNAIKLFTQDISEKSLTLKLK